LADKVRSRWNAHSHAIGGDWWIQPRAVAGDGWWSKEHPQLADWYYQHGSRNYDWQYWWTSSSWNDLEVWLADWGMVGGPVYYDYGTGGNVTYQGGNVLVNGQIVGKSEEFSQSAGEIATVPAATVAAARQEEWLPLGTFAVVTSSNDVDPSRVLQLAVDRQGIVSGTMHNGSTEKSYIAQGRIDKQTQRVALTIGDKANAVMETGLYNLTQPQTPAIIHYGTARNENVLLVRLDAPQGAAHGESGAASGGDN
jgi:hypothetical protein